MSISLKSNVDGVSGAIQVNDVDIISVSNNEIKVTKPLRFNDGSLVSTSPSLFAQREVTKNQGTGIIVPFYQYPSNVYSNTEVLKLLDVMKKYQNVPFIVVINPASGPGVAVDANYTGLIDVLHAGGARVLGYVATTFATRLAADVKADIDTWGTLYPGVDGIFLDEMNSTNATSDIAYYTDLTTYSHLAGYYPVVANPGTPVLATYYDAADIIVYIENSGYQSEATLAQFYVGGSGIGVDNSKKAVISYGVGFDFNNVELIKKNANWIYVTDQPLATAYNFLPSYLETLTAYAGYKTVEAQPGHNRLINGSFNIWQRGTSFPAAVAGTYVADRWQVENAGTGCDWAQVAGTGGFKYALQCTGNAANTGCHIVQKIEDVNCQGLAGNDINVSAVLSASTPQLFNIALSYCNTPNSFGTLTLVGTAQVNVTSVPTRLSAVFSGLPASAAKGLLLQIYPATGSFTSGTFTVTGVQLEAGRVATPFEYRSYGDELALCQRYCPVVYGVFGTLGMALTASVLSVPIPMLGAPRTTPTGIIATASEWAIDSTGASEICSSLLFVANGGGFYLRAGKPTANMVSGNVYILRSTVNNAKIIFTGCEL